MKTLDIKCVDCGKFITVEPPAFETCKYPDRFWKLQSMRKRCDNCARVKLLERQLTKTYRKNTSRLLSYKRDW